MSPSPPGVPCGCWQPPPISAAPPRYRHVSPSNAGLPCGRYSPAGATYLNGGVRRGARQPAQAEMADEATRWPEMVDAVTTSAVLGLARWSRNLIEQPVVAAIAPLVSRVPKLWCCGVAASAKQQRPARPTLSKPHTLQQTGGMPCTDEEEDQGCSISEAFCHSIATMRLFRATTPEQVLSMAMSTLLTLACPGGGAEAGVGTLAGVYTACCPLDVPWPCGGGGSSSCASVSPYNTCRVDDTEAQLERFEHGVFVTTLSQLALGLVRIALGDFYGGTYVVLLAVMGFNSRRPGPALSNLLRTYVMISFMNGMMTSVDLTQNIFLHNYPLVLPSLPASLNLMHAMQMLAPASSFAGTYCAWQCIKLQKQVAHESSWMYQMQLLANMAPMSWPRIYDQDRMFEQGSVGCNEDTGIGHLPPLQGWPEGDEGNEGDEEDEAAEMQVEEQREQSPASSAADAVSASTQQ
eukprot:NODE_5843_length_1729_cov_9.018727.p1 GENE.NODE_5843_length_1729_cov_9.018727~~NODE_5843_length_1729_cov_9.018727.p1  ORF type:complete len:484 (+),score=102.33 NODE_5843_length_1729_cov_9.018727:62-1453(+)